MLAELNCALILFRDTVEGRKIICIDSGNVVGVAVEGRILERSKDYHVFSRTRDGFESMKDSVVRHNISRTAKADTLVVETIGEMMEWVHHGERSGIQGIDAAPAPTQGTATEDEGMFSGCDPLFKTSLLDQGDDDLSGNPDWQALQGTGRPAGWLGNRFAQMGLEEPHLPRNRLTGWPFDSSAN